MLTIWEALDKLSKIGAEMGVNRPPASTYVFINKRLAVARNVRYSLSVSSRAYATGNTFPVGNEGKPVGKPGSNKFHFDSRLSHGTGSNF
jgi:hypothetical protein